MGFELERDCQCRQDTNRRDCALEQRLARSRVLLQRARAACARLRALPADGPERIAARLAYAQAAHRCLELEDALAGFFADEPDGDERG